MRTSQHEHRTRSAARGRAPWRTAAGGLVATVLALSGCAGSSPDASSTDDDAVVDVAPTAEASRTTTPAPSEAPASTAPSRAPAGPSATPTATPRTEKAAERSTAARTKATPRPTGPPRLGAQGSAVVAVQQRLVAHGWPLVVDGDFGARTDAALRGFQAAHGLTADGIAGAATVAALAAAPVTPKASTPQASTSKAATPKASAAQPKAAPKGTAAPTVAPRAAGKPSGGVVAQTNWYRAQHGCAPLTVDATLTRAAQSYASLMADQGWFAHESPDGTSFADRVRAAGYSAPAAENIARGQTSASQVMGDWMASPGHKANILNCGIKRIGVGQSGSYWVQDFGW